MFEVKNKRIKITKGDSAKLNVYLCDADGKEYNMTEGDTLTLTVRKRPNTEVLMQIVSTDNVITMTPDDTKRLIVGGCCYDVELKTAAGDVYTVAGLQDEITMNNMTVYPEITE